MCSSWMDTTLSKITLCKRVSLPSGRLFCLQKENTPFSECAFHEIERDENTVAYLQALKVYHVLMRTFCATKAIHIISIQPL